MKRAQFTDKAVTKTVFGFILDKRIMCSEIWCSSRCDVEARVDSWWRLIADAATSTLRPTVLPKWGPSWTWWEQLEIQVDSTENGVVSRTSSFLQSLLLFHFPSELHLISGTQMCGFTWRLRATTWFWGIRCYFWSVWWLIFFFEFLSFPISLKMLRLSFVMFVGFSHCFASVWILIYRAAYKLYIMVVVLQNFPLFPSETFFLE